MSETGIIRESDAKAIIEAAQQSQSIKERVTEIGGIPVSLSNGSVTVLDQVLRAADERADKPRRLRGTAKLTDVASFVAHEGSRLRSVGR